MKDLSPQFTINNAMTSALTQIERARGFLEAATLSEDWILRMGQRALLLEAHYTTHIEGTQLTLDQAEKIWEGEPVENTDPDDQQELLNYRDAFHHVGDYLRGGLPITESLIQEIHKRLVQNVRGDQGQPGRYRMVQNYVVNGKTRKVIYTPPAPEDVPALMGQLTRWLGTETDIHPVLVAAIAQFQLVHIHPFVDGNGRTSRLLSTLCLYKSGYDFKRLFTISEYYDRDRMAFYNAIQNVRNVNMDLTGWLEYFVTGLATQLDEVTGRGKKVILSDFTVKKHGLNERQAKVLQWFVEHEQMRISQLEILCPAVNRRTLQRDLKIMLEKEIIDEVGVGPTDPKRYYRLAEL